LSKGFFYDFLLYYRPHKIFGHLRRKGDKE